MKILRCGDMHVNTNNLAESNAIIDFIIEQAKANEVKTIEFLGDLFHTHAVIRLEVLDFWEKAFKKITKDKLKVIVLVGNHDQPGSNEKEQSMNSLNIFSFISGLTIVNKPMVIDNIGYMPHISDKKEFLKQAKDLHKKAPHFLVIHQTIVGAEYHNNFFAPDGIELENIPQTHIFAGHIHTSQIIGKCLYVGTPKWDTLTDANQKKNIWIINHDIEKGEIEIDKKISMEGVCTPIKKISIKEGDCSEIKLDPKHRNYIELHGKAAWINKMKKKFKGLANIKAKPTDRKIDKTDDVGKNLSIKDFMLNKFKFIEGVSAEDVDSFLKEQT